MIFTCLFVCFMIITKVYEFIRCPKTSFRKKVIIWKSAKFAYMYIVFEKARAFIRLSEKFLLARWVLALNFINVLHTEHKHSWWFSLYLDTFFFHPLISKSKFSLVRHCYLRADRYLKTKILIMNTSFLFYIVVILNFGCILELPRELLKITLLGFHSQGFCY